MTQHSKADPYAADSTGRIVHPILANVRRILFTRADSDERRREFAVYAQFDRAQIVMLHHVGLLTSRAAGRLLTGIEKLAQNDFAELLTEEASRGAYMLWEHAVGETAGSDLLGASHLGRSRNDLNAAMCRVQGREPCHRLVLEAVHLGQAILRRAREWRDVVTVALTNHQCAMPIVLPHQAAAWATAIERDVRHLWYASADLDVCPLGNGAVAGTSLPIDPTMTASLLGFAGTTSNSIDAVASRDYVLRVQAAAAVLAVTLGRIATDLLAMSTGPLPLMKLPDEVVGASSAMPQKRNPFVLEAVQSHGVTALGGFVASAQAMQATPYTNGFAVGTEAVRRCYTGLLDVAESAALLRCVVEVMSPNVEQMRHRAADAYVNSTALAERLCLRTGMGFRAAHHLVGRAVSAAIAAATDLATAAVPLLREAGVDPALVGDDWIDLSVLARCAEHGGGPGDQSVAAQIARLRGQFREHRRSVSCRRRQYRDANSRLALTVDAILRASDGFIAATVSGYPAGSAALPPIDTNNCPRAISREN